MDNIPNRKIKMGIKNIKIFLISSILYFSIIVFVLKYTGSVNRFTTAYFEPDSWSEIKRILPNIAFFSLIAGVFSALLINEGNKQKEKDIESARKRIAERELREKAEKKTKDSKLNDDKKGN